MNVTESFNEETAYMESFFIPIVWDTEKCDMILETQDEYAMNIDQQYANKFEQVKVDQKYAEKIHEDKVETTCGKVTEEKPTTATGNAVFKMKRTNALLVYLKLQRYI